MIYNQPARDVVAILSQPTAVWIVADTGAGFSCQEVDWLAGTVAAHEGVCVMPLGADATETARLVSEMPNALGIATRAEYLATMRRMATLFHVVADRLGPSGAVSDVVEVGALWRDDAGHVITEHLPPTATDNVRRASDDELEALLARSIVMQVGMLRAIAAVGASMAKLMAGHVAEEIAKALAEPTQAGRHLAAAAKYTAAAAIFGAISGSLSGAASVAGGGVSGSYRDTMASIGSGKGGDARIVIQGAILDMSDPEQADALGKAISDLTGRNVIVSHERGA